MVEDKEALKNRDYYEVFIMHVKVISVMLPIN